MYISLELPYGNNYYYVTTNNSFTLVTSIACEKALKVVKTACNLLTLVASK